MKNMAKYVQKKCVTYEKNKRTVRLIYKGEKSERSMQHKQRYNFFFCNSH